MEMSKLTWDRIAEPVSRDQLLRREQGQGNIRFPCSADHKQDWQPYLVDPSLAIICDDHTHIHTYYICSSTFELENYYCGLVLFTEDNLLCLVRVIS